MEESIIYVAARAAHEVNRIYCEACGDYSQPKWENAPEWQVKSALSGVQSVYDNPGMTAEMQYMEWMKAKIEDGWVYGEVKDVEKKTHPCMVDYRELPKVQQYKDTIFGSVVRGVLMSEKKEEQ